MYLTHKQMHPLGPYHRPMPRVLGGSSGGGRFLMCEVPLQCLTRVENAESYAHALIK